MTEKATKAERDCEDILDWYVVCGEILLFVWEHAGLCDAASHVQACICDPFWLTASL